MSRIKYTKEIIEQAVAVSCSWRQVCKLLGIKPATGAQTYITNRAKKYGVDTSHFTGQAWRKNKTFEKRPVSYYLVIGGPRCGSHQLKVRLIAQGIKQNYCEKCGQLPEWLFDELPMELDHKNGNHEDNRLENLQILCPNCHAVKTRYQRRSGGIRQTPAP